MYTCMHACVQTPCCTAPCHEVCCRWQLELDDDYHMLVQVVEHMLLWTAADAYRLSYVIEFAKRLRASL